MTPILNADQVAELLGCSAKTVADHARAGRLPGYKFGEGWIFSADLLVDAVKRMSLDDAAKRKEPAKPAALMLATAKRKQLPGFALLSADLQAQVAR